MTACLLNNQILTETTIQVIGSLVSQESWQVMPHALKSDDQTVINHSLVMPFLRPQCWSWGGGMCGLLVIPFDFGHVSAMGCSGPTVLECFSC